MSYNSVSYTLPRRSRRARARVPLLPHRPVEGRVSAAGHRWAPPYRHVFYLISIASQLNGRALFRCCSRLGLQGYGMAQRNFQSSNSRNRPTPLQTCFVCLAPDQLGVWEVGGLDSHGTRPRLPPLTVCFPPRVVRCCRTPRPAPPRDVRRRHHCARARPGRPSWCCPVPCARPPLPPSAHCVNFVNFY